MPTIDTTNQPRAYYQGQPVTVIEHKYDDRGHQLAVIQLPSGQRLTVMASQVYIGGY